MGAEAKIDTLTAWWETELHSEVSPERSSRSSPSSSNVNVWARIKLAEGAMPDAAATRESHGRDRGAGAQG
jgi:hypothetical protein